MPPELYGRDLFDDARLLLPRQLSRSDDIRDSYRGRQSGKLRHQYLRVSLPVAPLPFRRTSRAVVVVREARRFDPVGMSLAAGVRAGVTMEVPLALGGVLHASVLSRTGLAGFLVSIVDKGAGTSVAASTRATSREETSAGRTSDKSRSAARTEASMAFSVSTTGARGAR